MREEYVSRYNDSVRADQCYICPANHNLQTHHIVPQRMGGSDTTNNLVIVCERCHRKLESVYDKRFYERLGLSDDQGERRSHFVCSIVDCDTQAVMQIEDTVGEKRWWCKEHGHRLARRDDATVLQEVSA